MVSKAAEDEASKRRRSSLGLVDIPKSQKLAAEIGERGSSGGTVGARPSLIAPLPNFELSDT